MPNVKGLEHPQELRDTLGIPVLLIRGSLATGSILESAIADGLAPFPILAKPAPLQDLIDEIHLPLAAGNASTPTVD